MSFELTRELDEPALRAQLAGGRPEERMWAIWALALRTGQGAALGRTVVGEPDPGVRRTLAVMLAGHGEHDLLVALARHDPEPAVRDSALQLVTRLAIGGALPVASVLEAARTNAVAQLAVARALDAGAPGPLVELAVRMTSKAPREVQLEAFEALLRIATPHTLDRARAWLVGTRPFEESCDRWIRIRGVDSLARALAGAPANRRQIALARLRHPPWPVIERLVGGDVAVLRHVLGKPGFTIPARVLGAAILDGHVGGFADALAAQLEDIAEGRALHGELRAALEADEPDLGALFAAAHVLSRALEIPEAARVLGELATQHPVEQLLGLQHAAATWVAQTAPDDFLPLVPALRALCESRLAGIEPMLDRNEAQLRRLGFSASGEHRELQRLLRALTRC